jgi:uncharacterized DUF497 family protein
MEFDWTPAKCAKNIAERGIDFADVVVGFADPMKKVAKDATTTARSVSICSPWWRGDSFTSPLPGAERLLG